MVTIMATSVADRIAEIDTILAAGLSSVTYADRVVSYNLGELRKERDRLVATQAAAASGSSFRRVVFKGGSAL
jgi:hypothetical protein